jgi:hypothetical protein
MERWMVMVGDSIGRSGTGTGFETVLIAPRSSVTVSATT